MRHKTVICAVIFLMHLMTTTSTTLSSTVLHQYHLINESLTWHDAQRFCRIKYTDLATINNMDDENQLINTLSSDVTSTWIGLYNGQYNNWWWSDGSGRAVFTKWASGEPSNSGGIEACGMMYTNSLWNDAPCYASLAYVCYELQQDGNKTYFHYTDTQTWAASRDLCRRKHTDMACVHTLQENSQTLNPSANVWFGLFKDAWLWSDGAETSFRYWQTGQSYSGNCVSAESAQQGRWIQADCNQKTNFVCHGGLKLRKRVIRIKVQSAVDLTDPTAYSSLLTMLESSLIAQGLTDVKLKWQGNK